MSSRIYPNSFKKWHQYSGIDFAFQASAGLLPGISGVNKFGENQSVAANTEETVWDYGGLYSFPSSAVIDTVATDVDDVVLRGATITVEGLDANWELTTQTVTLDALNSATNVTLSTPLIRAFRAYVSSALSGTPSANVQISDGGVTVYAQITAGYNQTLMAVYTIPKGYTGFLASYYGGVTETPSTSKDPEVTEFLLYKMDNAANEPNRLQHEQAIPKGATGITHTFSPFVKLTEKTDIYINAECKSKAGHVHAGFDLYLRRNDGM